MSKTSSRSRGPSGATDLDLAVAVRSALAGVRAVTEVKMFGGIGFMLNGNLLAGASKRGLLLRVGKNRQAHALAKPHARQMEMRGRVMEDYIYIDPPIAPDTVRGWIDMARAFVGTLPPKKRLKREPTKAKKK